ncbi:hypothetical protein [Prosthecobacter sp.]|uniref:hypothetical protein n=1 Tax=Prosthecobacter sp. TaxID=1965333 RepID=UPI003783D8D6
MSRVLWLGVVLWVAGCGRSEKEETAPAPAPAVVSADAAADGAARHEDANAAPPARPVTAAESAAAAAAAHAPMTETAPQPKPKAGPELVLTPELESAVVVVRVAVPGTMMREHTGVILQRTVFAPAVTPESKRRYVATVIPGFDEAALGAKDCRIAVLREKVDKDTNGLHLESDPAKVVSFDAATHLAVLMFFEEFAYGMEEGALEVADSAAMTAANGTAEPVWLLEGMVNQDSIQDDNLQKYEGTQADMYGMSVTGLVDVFLLRAELTEGELRLAPGQKPVRGPLSNSQCRTHVSVVMGRDGRLLGLARPLAAPGLQAFDRLKVPNVVANEMSFAIESVEFPERDGLYQNRGLIPMKVKGVLKDPLKEFSMSKVAVRTLARPEDFTPAADLGANHPAMERDGELSEGFLQPDGTFSVTLEIPPGKDIFYHAVQLELRRLNGEVAFRTAPFMVATKVRGASLYSTLAGVPGAAAVAGAPAPGGEPGMPPGVVPVPAGGAATAAAVMGGPVELTTESNIVMGVPICEGREVLLRLEGAPHWKRLSLSERKWLPLPVAQEELSYCMLAGNKDAIFVLDPGRGELRRYAAGSLALEKTARMPPSMTYYNVAAGCLTDDGPVAVLGNLGALAFDARELTPELSPSLWGEHDARLDVKYVYQAAGDGSVVWGRDPKERGFLHTRFRYKGVLRGFGKELEPEPVVAQMVGARPTAGPGVVWTRREGDSEVAAPLTASACYYKVSEAEMSKQGALMTQARCSFYSFYSDEPWAVVDVPEARDVPLGKWGTFDQRVWLDPQSLTFALWHADRTITLRTLDKAALPRPALPVLLNYPDCHVTVAGGFRFKPLVLGGNGVVTVEDGPAGLRAGPDGTLEWQPPAEMSGRHAYLFLRLADSMPGQGAQVRMELRVDGRPPAVAVSASLKRATAEVAAAEAGSGRVGVPVVPLTSHFYTSDIPIQEVLPGLNDYMGLLLHDRTLRLISLKDWKEAGSRALHTNAAAFMAGDVVFTYNNITRELTRHSLPDFAVTHQHTLPKGARLKGVAVGAKTAGPVTLVLETEVPRPARGRIPAGTEMETSVLILDKETLDATRWAQYKPVFDPAKRDLFNPQPHLAWFSHEKDLPVKVPASADGRLVHFPKGVLMITPGLTVDFFFQTNIMNQFGFRDRQLPSATPTGDRVFNDGEMCLGGDLPRLKIGSGAEATLSSCGDYVACLKSDNDGLDLWQVRLYSANDGHPLLGLAGVELLELYDGEADYKRQRLTAMGEKKLLTVLSRGGFQLQGIDVDVAAACQVVAPAAAYVTSHPFPIVAEGRTLDYQITVNQPKAVSRYELRDPPPGARITPEGHLTYQTPGQLKESKQETISILIHFKSGDVGLHQFPVYVIALGAKAKGK